MPILNADTLEFISRSADQTRRLGARLGAHLQGGEVLALEGDLGTGKTVFSQGVGQGWGAVTPLISPTFILIRRHERLDSSVTLYHIDLYRLASVPEIETLGLEEILGDPKAISLVEWADRAPELIPPDRLWISLRVSDEYRRAITFQAQGERHQALLQKFRKEIIGL